MTRSEEILYMQIRLLRLAAVRWNQPDDAILRLFDQYQIYDYIETGYELFHLEGDDAVLDEIEHMLTNKRVDYK